ncbi:MAG: CBS domain-containing protein [Candidatus Omnitrophica bacterium]|nr:CBS domain-containing protein [Candidatus Omnitrophota bacterium]MBU2044038.1 CBS domain-containing protein [Candidatus Omnitrophota bacterium]MBU2250986.1 CBS domain-containing protein [Candidatus Omnitrophota bacterium]MBU2473914.1 CBS domain-containing protein [Candidatus Omnitrophota bacterium]
MLIKDIMTKKVITVSPEMDIHKLAELFMKKNISGAPVVDKNGKLLGVVKEEGLIFHDKKVHLPTFINLSLGFLTLGTKRYNEEIKKITAKKVSRIMEKDVVTIDSNREIESAATLMIEKESYYLPVVDKNKLVGVITKKDIVRAIAKEKA